MAASTRSLDKGPVEEGAGGPRPKKDMTVWLEYGRASVYPINSPTIFLRPRPGQEHLDMSADQNPVKVHRCRFVDYLPAAITALAFPPLPLPSLKGKAKATSPLRFPHLAVGRANGNIELSEWSNVNPTDQAPQAWVVLKVRYHPSFSLSLDERSGCCRLYLVLTRQRWTRLPSLCDAHKTQVQEIPQLSPTFVYSAPEVGASYWNGTFQKAAYG